MSKEMMDFFGFSEELATTSAFVQKRAKILPEAFESLFALFTNKFAEAKTYRGFQLLAVDGSDFLIMREWASRKTPFASGCFFVRSNSFRYCLFGLIPGADNSFSLVNFAFELL